ncbi:NfeD family protein [Opitutus sp. ER46]|uniref:NfeD family protein n=1 Tax=Opitutus sp. ER46 TaxID=2161864 RepID=UPI000D306DE3|nr:NfeD family protein [Opitutus sp. ER46]PTX96618.1 serine protease [Opitutus sp. ER46]
MNAVVLLFLVGIILLVFEVFTPGGILGILGGIAMVAGCVIAFQQFGATTGAVATGIAVLVLGIMLWAELVLLPKTRLGRKLFQDEAISARSQPEVANAVAIVGQQGEAATALAPSGYVVIAGRRYEAWSQTGFLPKGAAVRVIGLDNFRLIVTKT